MPTGAANRETAISVGSHRVAPDHHAPVPAPARVMAGSSRCPKTFDGLLDWLKEAWAQESFPTRIHGRGVFDGSVLGSPAENAAFAQHLERPEETNKSNHYKTPLHAALTQLAVGTETRDAYPKAAESIWSVIRQDFNWRGAAAQSHFPEELYGLCLAKAIEQLWWLYKAAPY